MLEVVLRNLGIITRTRDFMLEFVFTGAAEDMLLNLFGTTLLEAFVVVVFLGAVVVVVILARCTRRTARCSR